LRTHLRRTDPRRAAVDAARSARRPPVRGRRHQRRRPAGRSGGGSPGTRQRGSGSPRQGQERGLVSERAPTLGNVGGWIGAFAVRPGAEAGPAAREIDALGYDTLWYSEGLGTRESFTNAAVLLGATGRIRVASGIANIWGRDAVSAANAARVLTEAWDG